MAEPHITSPADSAAHPVPPSAGRTPDDTELLALANAPGVGLGRELLQFLAVNKKWWLTPIVVALLIVGALIVFGASAAGPFVYTLF